MLTNTLLSFTQLGAEWVLYLLLLLSLLSGLVMVERLIFFLLGSGKIPAGLIDDLRAGDVTKAERAVESMKGMVGEALRAGLKAAPQGAASVESVLLGQIASSKAGYERFLNFLGTLGNNAPFIGLFGTVLGIIRAFADLASASQAGGSGGGPDVVMAGISEALVATAVGLIVALPAVVAYNFFARWLKQISSNATAAGHALLAGLKKEN